MNQVIRREYRWRKCPKIDKSGSKFGRLTVIKFSHYKILESKGRRPFWECLCECGNIKIVDNSNLLSGNVQSCGCLHKDKLKDIHQGNIKREAAFLTIVRNYKRGAKARNLEYLLTEEQLQKLTQQNCYYCGIAPKQIMNKNGSHIFKDSSYTYNGVDRINNTKGYTIENCIPCCRECNWAKGTRTQEEFLSWVERISKFRKILYPTIKADLVT